MRQDTVYEAVCAGHVCLDITPRFLTPCHGDTGAYFVPGSLIDVGKLSLSTGGSVSNTGLALNKLGIPTALMAGVGEDEVSAILQSLMEKANSGGVYLHVKQGETTSYSIVLSPPGCDRIFLHDAAANNAFGREDVDFSIVGKAKLFHIGYPSIMRRLYENDGEELCAILQRVKALGVTTSLDTAYPDTGSDAARMDWKKLFARFLPYTDLILPSVEELLFMLAPAAFRRLKQADDDILKNITFSQIEDLADDLLDMGAAVAVIKCGALGFYAKTADAAAFEQKRFGRATPQNVPAWAAHAAFSPVFCVENVVSATGAGDSSIAGFIAALLAGRSLYETVNIACAAGAACITDYSATGAIPPMAALTERLEAGWKKSPCRFAPAGYTWDEAGQLWLR
ncbi:MAG: carbohydrate kinase family protein [Clostridia bacterium]|nr:carbohydrate kinase family protein [Clostridia bacterium]